MTPSEYRRMFLEVRREADESWSQVTARLETMFTYYLRSREVQSFESLQELLIADRLKQLMPNDLRSLVTQQEVKGLLKPKDIAELAANFEESLDGSRQSNFRGTALRNQHYRPQRTLEEQPRSEHQVPNTEVEANTSLEDEREGEQDAQALEPLATSSMSGLEQGQLESQNSVGEDNIEDSERLGPVTEISFTEEQKRDESVADAWRQAKEGSDGMVIDGQLLYHGEQLDGNFEMAPQAVKSCGQVSAAAQANRTHPYTAYYNYTDYENCMVMTVPYDNHDRKYYFHVKAAK
ncbi:hypothetical protein HPB50_022161 [Hyalomma asiaticum]|uniref:Uncharacterized protein n=1 Tax=Hyalomma asiaticum TaxID=266040 RepID=A0ACB7RVN3_HYAAI|nr:hypothetical protein HPB50_022161 [Hyalomma asiaticum]